MDQDMQLLHDMKQPLNVIRLAAGNMIIRLSREQGIEGQGYYSAKLEVIENQVDRMSAMIDEILDR